MNNIKNQIDKACIETYEKYGYEQTKVALINLLADNNPRYFTNKENRINMRNIDKTDLQKYMITTILETRLYRDVNHLEMILGANISNVENLKPEEVEFYLENIYENYGAEELCNSTFNKLNNIKNDVLGKKIVDTFVHDRYYNPIITSQDLDNFERTNYEAYAIMSEIANYNPINQVRRGK